MALNALICNTGDALAEGQEDIKCYIAALDTTQNIMVTKLALLEKVVTSVQDDMTCVKDEVRVVHEVLENLVEYVSSLTRTVAEVEGVPTHRPPDISAWGWGKDEEPHTERGRADTTGLTEETQLPPSEEKRSHVRAGHDADSAIRETQMYENSAGMYTNITSLSEEGGDGRWAEDEEGCPEIQSPPEQQLGGEGANAGMALGCTQMDMTLEAPQTGILGQGEKLWSQFASYMKSMDAEAARGGGGSDGWVSCKRGRASASETPARESNARTPRDTSSQEAFNLNLTPEPPDAGPSSRGRGRNVSIHGRGAGRRGGGRGGGRGAGRAKKLPQV